MMKDRRDGHRICQKLIDNGWVTEDKVKDNWEEIQRWLRLL